MDRQETSARSVLDVLISRQNDSRCPIIGIDAEIQAMLVYFQPKYDLSEFNRRYREVTKTEGYLDKLNCEEYRRAVDYALWALANTEDSK